MARELRFSEGTAVVLVLAVIAVVVGASTDWFGMAAPKAEVPAQPGEKLPTSLQLIPAIEKTKVYVSAYDQADFLGEAQKNRVAGNVSLIKSGVAIDLVATTTSGAAASVAEFNGGDKVTALGDASGYYANPSDEVVIDETLKPIEVFIKAAAAATVSIEDDNGDAASTVTLGANEVSKTHTLVVERPGDDTWYQFCGVAADYDDESIEPRLKVSGSYETGLLDLDNEFDKFDTLGYEAVWEFDQPVKNFDETTVDFIVGTKKDVDPAGVNLTLTAFDCEHNLQNGKIVYTNENSADADVGLADISAVLTVN